MNITCPNCGTVYRLPGSGVKSGTKLRCSVCRHIFLFPERKEKEEFSSDELSLNERNTLESRESGTSVASQDHTGDLSLEQGEKKEEFNGKSSQTSSLSLLPESDLVMRDEPSGALQNQGFRVDTSKAMTSKLEMPQSHTPHFQGWVTLLLCLAILGGAWWMWENTPYLDGIKQLFFQSVGKEKLNTEAASPTAELELRDVHEYSVMNEKIGKILVIEGKVHNGASTARSFIRLEGKLSDDKGNELSSQKQLAGTSMNRFQLQVLNKEELENALKNRLDIVSENMNVQPGSEVPFIIVFTDVPENASDYKVSVVEAEITDKPGNLSE